MPQPEIRKDTAVEEAYRARSAKLRGMAETMSAGLRETMLDAAIHWETMAKQAESIARSKKLIKDCARGRDSAYETASP